MQLSDTVCGKAAPVLGANMADRLRVAAELLVAGVAFKTDNKTWEVFSHNGEHIGTMSTYMVCETARALKALKLKSTCITQPAKGEQASITFGFDFDRWPSRRAEMAAIIERRERRFVTLH